MQEKIPLPARYEYNIDVLSRDILLQHASNYEAVRVSM